MGIYIGAVWLKMSQSPQLGDCDILRRHRLIQFGEARNRGEALNSLSEGFCIVLTILGL